MDRKQGLEMALQSWLIAMCQGVLFERAINDAGGQLLGALRIMEGQEPADRVYRFATKHGQDAGFRQGLLQHVD